MRLSLKDRCYNAIGRMLNRPFISRSLCRLGMFQPRVVTKIDGGLGSQMWQFALGYAVAQKRRLKLSLELSFYQKSARDCNGKMNRFFYLFDTFPRIKEKYASATEKSKLFLRIFRDRTPRSTYTYTPQVFESHDSLYLSEYYANAKYIMDYRDELRELFDFDVTLNEQEVEWKRMIQESNSCSLHIRKGDFVGICLDVCSDDYYINAIKTMIERIPDVTFFIFSNDEDYFISRILPHCPSIKHVVLKNRTEEDPRADLYLMKLCKHSIISNSGFSWIAAFLKSDTSITIMPDYWNNDPQRKESSKDAFYIQGYIKLPTA